MVRFPGQMRLCAIIAAAAGCSSGEAPPHDRGHVSIAAHDDARPVDATAPVLASADANEVIPAFDFIGAGVPIGFGGVALGDPLPAFTQRRGTFAGAGAELWVSSDDGTTVSQISFWIEGDIEPVLAKRFGPVKHKMWKGAASWLVEAPQPFDFSGTPATQLVIVQPDEHHVCGHDDGFASFYAAFQRSVRARDWASVTRSMTFPQTDWSDVEGADEAVVLSGPVDLVGNPSAVFRFELRAGTVTCDLGAREYTIVFGAARRSPAIYAVRGVGGVWRIIEVGFAPHDLF